VLLCIIGNEGMVPKTNGDYYMSKTFDVAGVSTKNGAVKFRVANGKPDARAKVLAKDGHTDIDLFQLAKPMTKEQVFALLAAKGYKETKEGAAKPTAKVTKPVAAPKVKAVAKPAPKVVKKVEQTVAEAVAEKPDFKSKNIDEVVRIKAKNLETMRAVTNKLRALREF